MNDQLTIETFVEPTFGENAYVVSSADASGQQVALIIDPSFPPQVDRLLEYIAVQGMRVASVVLTHGHADHIAGLDEVRAEHPAAGILIASEDAAMLGDAALNLSAPFGIPIVVDARAAGDLQPGSSIALGSHVFSVLDTSGHSPGGRSLYCAEAGVVFAGDALFAGSIGRTDFPGSNHQQLIRNIRQHLLTLPPETVVYSGHGPATTVGEERKSNPFLAD